MILTPMTCWFQQSHDVQADCEKEDCLSQKMDELLFELGHFEGSGIFWAEKHPALQNMIDFPIPADMAKEGGSI